MTSQTSPITSAQASVQGSMGAGPIPALVKTTLRPDSAEVRRLRARLLKLILQDQLRRDDQSHRGLPVRNVG